MAKAPRLLKQRIQVQTRNNSYEITIYGGKCPDELP